LKKKFVQLTMSIDLAIEKIFVNTQKTLVVAQMFLNNG
jgi:hypothetical protein